jgi:hypothetical protein
MLARQDMPLRPSSAKTAEAQLGGGPSLQSLVKKSHGSARSGRAGEVTSPEAIGTR